MPKPSTPSLPRRARPDLAKPRRDVPMHCLTSPALPDPAPHSLDMRCRSTPNRACLAMPDSARPRTT